mmetsp:Transcript_60038/g.141626  ORF Transcript_60038/g.141626 Transcript_60038/m.141626 type:complete len:471 (+) Transcript_60038:414-1826(+)
MSLAFSSTLRPAAWRLALLELARLEPSKGRFEPSTAAAIPRLEQLLALLHQSRVHTLPLLVHALLEELRVLVLGSLVPQPLLRLALVLHGVLHQHLLCLPPAVACPLARALQALAPLHRLRSSGGLCSGFSAGFARFRSGARARTLLGQARDPLARRLEDDGEVVGEDHVALVHGPERLLEDLLGQAEARVNLFWGGLVAEIEVAVAFLQRLQHLLHPVRDLRLRPRRPQRHVHLAVVADLDDPALEAVAHLGRLLEDVRVVHQPLVLVVDLNDEADGAPLPHLELHRLARDHVHGLYYRRVTLLLEGGLELAEEEHALLLKLLVGHGAVPVGGEEVVAAEEFLGRDPLVDVRLDDGDRAQRAASQLFVCSRGHVEVGLIRQVLHDLLELLLAEDGRKVHRELLHIPASAADVTLGAAVLVLLHGCARRSLRRDRAALLRPEGKELLPHLSRVSARVFSDVDEVVDTQPL